MPNSLERLLQSLPPALRASLNRACQRKATPTDLLWHQPGMLMERAGLTPDPWQTELLRNTDQRTLLLTCRQAGKSSVTAALALKTAVLEAPALVLLLSPTQRQSGELFRKVLDYLHAWGAGIEVKQETLLTLELANGSRIVSLPENEAGIRGYSSVALLVIDEASRVSDELYRAVRPMLAVSQGRLLALSTPFGRRGWFHDAWHGAEGWNKVSVTANQCPRITPAFLAEELRELGSRWYQQEYFCEFTDMAGALFRPEWFGIVTEAPADLTCVRCWDLAATDPKKGEDPDWTVGALVGRASNDVFYVLDVRRTRTTPAGVEALIRQTAELDGHDVAIWMEREPGSSGVNVIDHYARHVLIGYNFRGELSTGPKPVRAQPFASAAEAGNVKIVAAPWNRAFLDELSMFPLGNHDDQVDSAAGAHAKLSLSRTRRFAAYG